MVVALAACVHPSEIHAKKKKKKRKEKKKTRKRKGRKKKDMDRFSCRSRSPKRRMLKILPMVVARARS